MNVGRFLANAAERDSDKAGFVWGNDIVPYREANARSDGLAGALRRFGLGHGERVGVLMPNCPQLLESMFATWKAGALADTVAAVNASGFGLTMGLHTRIAKSAEMVELLAEAGNLYVNRSMIGAIVGSQPFGGEGLSGTGPKAGGPNYLPRFCAERVTSTDTTSAGGNATLLSMSDVGI